MSARVTLTAVLVPVFLVAGFGLTGAQSADDATPAEGIDYAKWTALTANPIPVTERLFTACESRVVNPQKLKELDGPHFVGAVKLFGNADAEKALKLDPKAVLPVSGTIVKEKLASSKKDAKLIAYGAMIKREKGYDAEHGDWEYVYADLSDAKPKIERGKIASCIKCHSIAKERDYLFRTHLGAADKK